jgi:polar amino acid transport system substrate-binding protein
VTLHDLTPTGSLRAAINLGNPVLTHGTPAAPGGVTVAVAAELARRLGVPLELVCVDAARKSFTSLVDGSVDVSFLAIEPAREEDVAFSPPYLAIEGVYVVAADAPFGDAYDVDRPGVTIGVKEGSAYDLYLTRTLEHAEVVRGSEGTTVLVDRAADVGAGIRQPVTAFVGDAETYRLLEPAFMQIRQAVGVARDRGGAAASYIAEVVDDLVASGFVRAELARAGQDPDLALDR